MSNPFRSREFLELQRKWNKKLQAEDFQDVESPDRRTGELRLKEWDSFYFQINNNPEIFAIKQEYYYRAAQFLEAHAFDSKTDKHVWKLHSEGMGVRVIAESLVSRGLKTNKDYVARIVNRLKRAMKEAPKLCENQTSSQSGPVQMAIWDLSKIPGLRASALRTSGSKKSSRTPILQIILQLSLPF